MSKQARAGNRPRHGRNQHPCWWMLPWAEATRISWCVTVVLSASIPGKSLRASILPLWPEVCLCRPWGGPLYWAENQGGGCGGRYLVPGLCDAHMHVESGMVTVTEFTRAVIPHGTTSMFIDPHEIANVLGLEGVRLMHDEALAMPINVHVQMPSCVPSAPGLEHAGAAITPD